MRFLKRLIRNLNTEKRFQRAFENLESQGFVLFMDYLANGNRNVDMSRKARNYKKNWNKVDELYIKWKN